MKVVKRGDLKCYHHKKEIVILWGQGNINKYYSGNYLTLSNQRTVQLTQYYMWIIYQ